MFETDYLSYRETNCFSELICDYLEKRPEIAEFYGRYPSIENFGPQIDQKRSFSQATRAILVNSLQAQYKRLNKPKQSITPVLGNIEKLSSTNTFTVTTGHQLNIFTGPLFFIYKIIGTIKLASKLREHYPEYNFVPVYWMATEDHDFDEIKFINLYGGRLTWDRESGGPVGRLDNTGLALLIDELKEHLGPGTNNEVLTELFKRAYGAHDNLADATRYLVTELFGAHGLVCIDGDDRDLKKLMIPYFEKELLESKTYVPVHDTTEKLEELHFKQVQPRSINLFYIKNGLRERIEKRKDRWMVLNTEFSFNQDEINEELASHPERFSPNVITRPLYQEVILPNLAYIGGGGELAYWLQLRSMFEEMAVPFPLLILRNSVLWVKHKYHRKLNKLEIPVKGLFQPLHEIKKQYVSERAPVKPSLTPYEEKLQRIFDELEEVANLTDDSMLGAVNAQRAKQLKGLENLRKKLIRAEKRRRSDEMEQIERLYLALFPAHSLQERHDNLSVFYSQYGDRFMKTLFDNLDPLDFRFTIIKELE
jgi:bacillithiol biosynthesis cysteine-adding enzyme BshC